MATWIARARRTVSVGLLGALVITAGSVWLGAQALSGGIRTVWFLLAAVFAWISLSRLTRLWWNLGLLLRHRTALIAEFTPNRTGGDEADNGAGSAVIEMVERSERDGGPTMFVISQEFAGGQWGAGGDTTPWLRLLGSTARAGLVTVVVSTLVTAVFALLALVFLLALAI